MCSPVKLSTDIQCSISRGLSFCGGVIINEFYFKQGANNPVKNKYYCSSCGVRYEPTNKNRLAFSFGERSQLAKFLFDETSEFRLIKNIPKSSVFKMSENGLIKYSSNVFVKECLVRFNKNHLFNENEKIQVFVPELGFKEFYIPIEYVRKQYTEPD